MLLVTVGTINLKYKKKIPDLDLLMSVELIVLIAALIVSWLVFAALINVVKTTVKTAIEIAAIVLVLQLVFGIAPQALWQQMTQLPEILWHLVTRK